MPSRAHGDGTIFKRADGRWAAELRLPDHRVRTWYAKTKRQAADKLSLAREAVAKNEPLEYSRQPLGDYLKEWLEGVKPRIAPSTWQRYEQLVRLHIAPAFAAVQLSRLQPQQLQAFYAGRLAAGCAPRSVRHMHALLHGAMRQAYNWRLIPRNPVDAVSPPKPARKEMQTLSAEQVRAMLTTAAGDRLEALYVLAVTTGMRQGEILALRWSAVDLDRATLSVRASVRRMRGAVVFGEPKNAGSRRAVPLTSSTVTALRSHRSAQAAERLQAGPAWHDIDLVFANEAGGVIDVRNLMRRSFHLLLPRAGLPRVRFHDLRHTAATLLLEQGVPLKVVSEMLGHKSIAITADLYSHVSLAMARGAADAMETLVGSR